MPYPSNEDLPKYIRDRYSSSQQSVFRKTFNSVFADTGDEGMAFAVAHKQAKAHTSSEDTEYQSSEMFDFNGMNTLVDEEIEDSVTIELMRPAFGSSGGKSKVVKRILMMMPQHTTYAEPFAGGGAVYWNKMPAEREVLNDFDSGIANTYAFIKTCSDDEIANLSQRNWVADRNLFYQLKDNTTISENRTDNVYKFYYLLAHSYGANMKGFGYKMDKNVRFFDRLPQLRERMRNTDVYNTDYKEILTKYDSPDTFFFLDPPYPQEWAGPGGNNLWGNDKVDEFVNSLKAVKGNFLVTINNLDWIREKFSSAGFNLYFVPVPRTLNRAQNDQHVSKIELFVTNYKLSDDIKREVEKTDNLTLINSAILLERDGCLELVLVPNEKSLTKELSSIAKDSSVTEYMLLRVENNDIDRFVKGIELMKPEVIHTDTKKMVSELSSKENMYFDKVYLGNRYCIIKKGSEVIVRNEDGKPVSNEILALFTEEGLNRGILAMSNDDFVIDTQLYNNRGKFELICSDILYLGYDVTNKDLQERKRILARLSFHDPIKEQKPLPVNSDDYELAINMYSTLYGSVGCYAKDRKSAYVSGKRNEWVLYSKENTLVGDSNGKVQGKGV